MNKAEKLVSNIMSKMQSLAKKLNLVSDVYKEDKKGEYSLVNKEIIEEIKSAISEMKKTINELTSEAKGTKIETINEINTYLDNIIINAEELDIDAVKTILLGTVKSIKKETTQVEIGTPTEGKRGGKMGTIATKEQGKIGEQKNVGGVIVSKDDESTAQNIGGEYTKLDEVIERIEIAMEQIADLSKSKEVTSKDEIKEKVDEIVEENMDKLIENCEKSAEDLQDVTKVKNVKKQKSFEGLYKVAAVGLTIALLFSGVGKKDDFKVAIPDNIDSYQVEIMSDIELQEESILDSIENSYTSKESAGSEAEEVGDKEVLEDFEINSYNGGAEVAARNEKIDNIEVLKNYKKTIENINNEYSNIESPTNSQWLDYQIKLNNTYKEMMAFNIQVEEKTNEYLDTWNALNEEHISRNVMSKNAVEAHNTEISLNDDSIARNEEQIADIQSNIEETTKKIEFYEQLKKIPNIEDVKNIEDVSESLNRFMQTDIAKKMSTDELMEFMKGTDLNLFSAYTKINVNDSKDFFEGYKLMENTYKEYVDEYCDGDNTQVQEEMYAQYFEKAVGFTDKVGETGFIDTYKAMLQQNNINNNFYEEYGHKDVVEEKKTDGWSGIKRSIKTLFDGQRKGEYKDTIEEISEMQKEVQQQEHDIDK